jgi:hypothetical protein
MGKGTLVRKSGYAGDRAALPPAGGPPKIRGVTTVKEVGGELALRVSDGEAERLIEVGTAVGRGLLPEGEGS